MVTEEDIEGVGGRGGMVDIGGISEVIIGVDIGVEGAGMRIEVVVGMRVEVVVVGIEEEGGVDRTLLNRLLFR